MALLAALWLIAGCGNDPDLLARGATELPGTAHADYLSARPFSLAPDTSMLVFAAPLSEQQQAGDTLAFDLGRLASFRILDLASGSHAALPALPAEQHAHLERHGLLHQAPCWHADSRTLLFRTTTRGYLSFGPLYADPTWSQVEPAPAGLDPACGERPGPFIGTRTVGRFMIERHDGKDLRVRHPDAAGILLEVQPGGLSDRVNVSDARLSPRGDRLVLVYSSDAGSFAGRSLATVVSVRAGDPPLHPLGRGVLVVDWLDDRRLVGYARPDGRRDYALFTWALD